MNQMVNRGETAAVGGLAQMGRCTRQRRRAVYLRGRRCLESAWTVGCPPGGRRLLAA